LHGIYGAVSRPQIARFDTLGALTISKNKLIFTRLEQVKKLAGSLCHGFRH